METFHEKTGRRRLRTPAVHLLLALAATATFGCSGSPRGSSREAPPATSGWQPTFETGAPDVANGPADVDIALHVEDFGGLDRTGEAVRSGVPIPRSLGMTDVSDLIVVGPDGADVPSQVRVTSRWGGTPDDATRPIKWLLVDFLADVPASGTSTYRLRSHCGGTHVASHVASPGLPFAATGMVTTNDASRIVVDTGAARFQLSKTRFNLFDRVTLANGTDLVVSDPDAGVVLQRASGSRYFAAADTTSVEVEEDGPVRTVVVARGTHKSNGSNDAYLWWTMRVHFVKGRAEAEVAYTFHERGLPKITDYIAVDELAMTLPVNTGSARFAFGGSSRGHTGTLASEAWLRQRGNLSPEMSATFDPGNSDTLHYQTGGAASGSGSKAPGWMSVAGSRGGVVAAVRWFWQQYPKKLTAQPGRLAVELWPSEEPDMRVYAASQKTHEVLWAFHGPDTSGEKVGDAAARRFDAPLFARANPSWYARSWVYGKVGTANASDYAGYHKTLMEKYFARIFDVEYPATFVSRRFDSSGRGHSYSMWDFGDLRDTTFSNAAYDTPRSLLVFFAITGDRRFLDRGRETALHLRDVDIEHSPRDTRAGVMNHRDVPMPWLGRTRYNPAKGPQVHDLGYRGATGYAFEHSKGQGLADHYFLTGDAMSKEVLAETYHYYEQWKRDADNGFLRTGGSRTVGHMLNIVLGYYDAFGTQEARDRADFIVSYLHDWQRRTHSRDPNGWMWLDDDGNTSSFQNAVTAESLILYETMFPDGIPVRQNLVDAARWTVDPSRGQLATGSRGRYFNAWTGHNYGITHATVLDAMMGPMLAYATDATGEWHFRDIAMEVLENCIEQDTSASHMKSYTQQTRLVPGLLWSIQEPEARREAGQ